MPKNASRIAARIVAVCLSAIVFMAVAVPAQAVTADEKSVAWRINNEHYKRSIRSLAVWESLSNTARAHSCSMKNAQRLYHSTNLGSKVRGWRILGENVAMGGNLYSIHLAWMNSYAHRDNILERRYTALGVGSCRDSNGTFWVTTIFYG